MDWGRKFCLHRVFRSVKPEYATYEEPKMISPVRCILLSVAVLLLSSAALSAQEGKVVLTRGGSTILLEPYAPNILRVTLSLNRQPALAAPGFGFVAAPSAEGWSASQTERTDLYKSARMVVTLDRDRPSNPEPPDPNQTALGSYFSGSVPGAHITFTTPDGKKLLEMTGWEQAILNQKDGTAEPLHDLRASDPQLFTVGANFVSPDDEHYYGLGQNQEGFLDHRGHVVRCWHDYLASAGQSVCVPFVVTNKGYGLLWDNPSKTTFEPGFNEQTKWTSQVGDRVSFFVIAGATADEIYAGYRLLTGPTPIPPKAAFGYIQCKQRYSSQKELLDVAQGYRDSHLPAKASVCPLS